MTEYLKGRFTVPLMGSQAYRDNWDAIFGKKSTDDDTEESKRPLTPKERRAALKELTRLTEEAGGYDAEVLPPGHVRLPGGGIRKPRQR